MALGKGVCLNEQEKGLLTLDQSFLEGLINSRSITDVYVVEQTPFAR